MAVLDHHDLQPAKELNGYVAVGNVCLVFVSILALAYLFSLIF